MFLSFFHVRPRPNGILDLTERTTRITYRRAVIFNGNDARAAQAKVKRRDRMISFQGTRSVANLWTRLAGFRGVVSAAKTAWLPCHLTVGSSRRFNRSRLFSIGRLVLLYGERSTVRAGVDGLLRHFFGVIQVTFRGVLPNVGRNRVRPAASVGPRDVQSGHVVYDRCSPCQWPMANVYVKRRYSNGDGQRPRNRVRLLFNWYFGMLTSVYFVARKFVGWVVQHRSFFCGCEEGVFNRFAPCLAIFVCLKVLRGVTRNNWCLLFYFIFAVFTCRDGDRAADCVVSVSRFAWVFWACSRAIFPFTCGAPITYR